MEKNTLPNLEEKYQHFSQIQAQFAETLENYQQNYQDFVQLRAFYGSDGWYESRQTPNDADAFSILSEDTLYNLFVEHSGLLEKMLDQSAKMYKSL
ncbi:DUF4298 domain-containing protein [Streptococcus uberis]|uniref:DUF4298 domain-containing protein n=1 Tax=Streptococcus uberis TaxID=1349 RepID=UPI0027DE7F09|nr:DUF4298 domain-containing protein [Streptococcus uberis]MCK1241605.1 DUF4298 domain-containing protein [Streptococcus uberis]